MSDVILERLKTIQDAVDKMSPQEVHLRFELSEYKKENEQLKQQLEVLKKLAIFNKEEAEKYHDRFTEAVEVIEQFKKSLPYHEEEDIVEGSIVDRVNQFIAKYRG